METIELNNGVVMPQTGFGVFQVTDQAECERAVADALEVGYRLVDTAACYGNERAVGAAIAKSGVAREDVFVTSKVWIQDAGYERTRVSFEKTLANLGTDYLDLYLIHMPYGDYHGSWRAMEKLLAEGRVRHRRVQLPARPSGRPRALPRRGARRQPDRAAPVLPTARLARAHGPLWHPRHGLGALRRGPGRHLRQPRAG